MNPAAVADVARRRHEDAVSFEWREYFLFTKTFTKTGGLDIHTGWQCTCNCHRNCRTNRGNKKHGGSDMLLRKLKLWCAVGSRLGELGTAEDHASMGLVSNDETPDDQTIEELPIEAPAQDHRRKRPRFE